MAVDKWKGLPSRAALFCRYRIRKHIYLEREREGETFRKGFPFAQLLCLTG